jgi:hypothetical protein
MTASPGAGLPRALRAVADITVVSGAVQMVKPGWVLGQLSAEPPALARQLFGTIGMFMVVSGGTMRRALNTPSPDQGVLVWAVAQKLGASTAVCIGVRRGLFSPRALPVAAFDLASGLGCLAYLWRQSRDAGRSP